MSRRRERVPTPADEQRVEAALAELGDVRSDPLAVADALRVHLPAHLARLAAERLELRRRAASKLARADELRLVREGLEQATDRRVAAWRAARFAEAGGTVLDATAGIGGDAMQLVAHGLAVLALEPTRLRAAYLAHNLAVFGGGLAVRGDAARPPVAAFDGLLVDPDRRAGAGRTLDPRSSEPSWDRVLELVGRARALACAKLAPGLSPAALRAAGLPAGPRRTTWVSLGRELKELDLWVGPALADGSRGDAGPHEAVAIEPDGTAHHRTGHPAPPPPLERERLDEVAWLAVVDPALVRAGLVGELAEELDLAAATDDGGYLAGDACPRTPWAVPFRVLDGAALDRRRVRQMLARHDVGPVTVKKRGIGASADDLARRLKGKGDRPGTLLVARHAAGHHVWLVERAG